MGHRARGLQRRRRRPGSTFPHDHARSRAYRWGEDGLAGFSDVEQRLCLALALWNGRDPILKERIFGLTGNEGNHGEDAKEYWWYLDALPSHAWNRWRYHYPQARVPVRRPGRRERPPRQARPRVRAARHRRVRRRPLLDRRGRLRQGRPARPADVDRGHERRARGRHAARAADGLVPQHVGLGRRTRRKPELRAQTARRASSPSTRSSGALEMRLRRRADGPLLRERDERASACSARRRPRACPKDGINDHVVAGAATVAPDARDEGRVLAPGRRRAGRDGRSCACASGRPRAPARDPWRDFDTVVAERAAPRPTSSTPS